MAGKYRIFGDSKLTGAEPATLAAHRGERSVLLTFGCPKCGAMNRQAIPSGGGAACACGWAGSCDTGSCDTGSCDTGGASPEPEHCLVCGCHDLWRQKDFPQGAGLLMVGLAIVSSTIAYALWRPILALGILMFFALIDAAIYALMRDVLVCYRCRARHGGFLPAAAHPTFDLETAERYRQERLRLEALAGRPS
jgi:hypothetical protein